MEPRQHPMSKKDCKACTIDMPCSTCFREALEQTFIIPGVNDGAHG